jgi:RHS repeat-associated protein
MAPETAGPCLGGSSLAGAPSPNPNGIHQTRTTTKDSQGNVVSVTDAANNTTSYAYDPFGKLIRTTDAVGNIVTATYDVRGRKTASNDPDLGAWTYSYDTASELVSQTDAKSQTSTFSYDLLGRMTQRVEPDVPSGSITAVWVYDTAMYGIGNLASAGITAGTGAGYQKSFTFNNLGRPATVTLTVDGTARTFTAGYDANSRLSSVTYPSGFVATYSYTSLGYALGVTGPGSQVYWTANARDAELRLTQQTAGNGVVTTQSFDALTDRLTSILAGSGNVVENFSYTYDVLGNMLSRADANQNLTETFSYDSLNRLTQTVVNQSLTKAFTYDPIGNLLSKSDVGTYSYPLAGAARPHAVLTITPNPPNGGSISTSFVYDNNGNQTSGLGRSISYTSYNKPYSIQQGSTTLTFTHDVDHQRYKQVAPEGTTLYFDAFGVHAEMFGSSGTWYDYVSAGGAMLGVRVTSGSTVTTRYFHTDNLGSIAIITDETGAVVERDGYDAWGKRRFPNGADDPTGSLTSQTTRGFTGQEELADVGLVHLNGRVYDPLIARMTSADPMVPDPMNGQAWNRYSYVINNPLAFTDPSGYCFLGLCGLNAISDFFHDTSSARRCGGPRSWGPSPPSRRRPCAGPARSPARSPPPSFPPPPSPASSAAVPAPPSRPASSPPQPWSPSMRSGSSRDITLRSIRLNTTQTLPDMPLLDVAKPSPPAASAGPPPSRVASPPPQGLSSTDAASSPDWSPTPHSAAVPPCSAAESSRMAQSQGRSGTCLMQRVGGFLVMW